jgi:hypothetical protein
MSSAQRKVRFAKYDDDLKKAVRVMEVALLNTEIGEVIDFERMMYESSYGKLTMAMRHAMHSHVKNKRVFDLGAGDLSLSKILLGMGAKAVVAIDKELTEPKTTVKGLETFRGSFLDFVDSSGPVRKPTKAGVAFLSWPSNHKMNGLLELVDRCSTVVYLGKNTDGSACAWPEFFGVMAFRPVLEHVPHKRNTLIVWGKKDMKLGRAFLREERAGMDQSKEYKFEEGK